MRRSVSGWRGWGGQNGVAGAASTFPVGYVKAHSPARTLHGPAPGRQSTHTDAPIRLYRPTGHHRPVAVPEGHAYPAGHASVHWAEVAPAVPYRPALHVPEQDDDEPPAAPHRPAAQGAVQFEVVDPGDDP
jgi:hypothetical protein